MSFVTVSDYNKTQSAVAEICVFQTIEVKDFLAVKKIVTKGSTRFHI